MLLQGGDTDTNACIVGGLIGAAEGISNIPEKLYRPMLESDNSKIGNKRPSFLIPKYVNLPEMVKKLYENAPKTLTILNGIEEITKIPEIKKDL